MNKQNFKRTLGFSLVELAVVIAIVGLLAAVAVPAYKNYISRARMAQIYGLLQSQLDYVEQSHTKNITAVRILVDTGLSQLGIAANPTKAGGTVVINFLANSALLSPYFKSPVATTVTYTATNNGSKLDWEKIPCEVGPSYNPNKAAIQANLFPKCKVL